MAHLGAACREHHQRHTANGSCRPEHHLTEDQELAGRLSPAQIVTTTAGTMAIIRVTSRRSHGAMRQ